MKVNFIVTLSRSEGRRTGKISEMQMGIGRERVYLLSLSKKQQFSPFPREEALPTFSPVSPTLLGIEEKKAEFVE